MSSSVLNNNENGNDRIDNDTIDDDKINLNKIRILYASQTGQAESISQLIYDQLRDSIVQSDIVSKWPDFDLYNYLKRFCVSDYDKLTTDFWKTINNNNTDKITTKSSSSNSCSVCHTNNKKNLLIIVASTTGQGDPPDKATKFFRWLRRLKRENKQTEFKHLTYALLGLGDTNYDNFANFSKQLNKFFKELGAIPYIEPGSFVTIIIIKDYHRFYIID